jgi:hypothetical protein
MNGMTTMGRRVVGIAWLAALCASPLPAQPITPDDPGPGDLKFTISAAGAAKPISPYIYGVNFYGSSGFTNPVTLDRLGGNRWSAYNWETNASNAGKDWHYQNDSYLFPAGQSNPLPGASVLGSLQSAAANNRGLVVTVPMAGYVAADANGTQIEKAQFAPSVRFKEVQAKRSSIYPGSLPFSDPNSPNPPDPPNESDNYVFTDEFVNWVEKTRQPDQQVFYSLDNEPALWGDALPANFQSSNWNQPNQPGRTHPEIHPYAPTYTEMRDKTIAHAGAIKDVNPNAIVFGGVGYGWAEFNSLQSAPGAVTTPSHPGGDQGGELNYYEWLLDQVHKEEVAQGRKLMDVLDLHWYPEATGGGTRISFDNSANPSAALVQARVQAPRSLWDPTYTETSWITNCCSGGPIKLLKHVQRDIADFNPDTKISVTEYNYGGGRHISGGVAQADVLGIFGTEGVFAATAWPIDSGANSQFTAGGFKMYLDYDGAAGDGKYGDLAIDAATDNISQSAVYASLDSDDPTRMVLVAINRTTAAKDVALQVTAERRFEVAEVYQLTSASANPVRKADLSIDLVNAFHYAMPAMSVTTLVLRSFLDGDFNMDGRVTAADLTAWATNAGMTSGASFGDGDNDRDGDVDGDDFLAWQRNLGAAATATAYYANVPEPWTLLLAFAAGLSFHVTCRRTAGEGPE